MQLTHFCAANHGVEISGGFHDAVILDEQRDLVLSAYEADNLVLRDSQSIEGWSTLVLQKTLGHL